MYQEKQRAKPKYLEPPSQLLVEKEPRELSSAGPLQELHEDLPERALHLIRGLLELLVPHEVGLVVISLELLKQSLEFILVQVLVDLGIEQLLHLVEIGGVEPRGQEGLLDGLLVGLLGGLLGGGRLSSDRHSDGGEPGARGRPGVGQSWGVGEFRDGFEESHLCCHCLELGSGRDFSRTLAFFRAGGNERLLYCGTEELSRGVAGWIRWSGWCNWLMVIMGCDPMEICGLGKGPTRGGWP